MSNSQRIQENNARIEAVTELLKTKAGGGGFVPAGTIDITNNGLHNVKNYESANVQVQPTLQEKTATDNGEVIADEGYDGLSKVTVNVEKGITPTGTLEVTENGEHNVATYEKVNVNVASGGGDDLNKFITNTATELTVNLTDIVPYAFYQKTKLKTLNGINTNATSTIFMYSFAYMYALEKGNIIINYNGTSTNPQFNYMFYNSGVRDKEVDLYLSSSKELSDQTYYTSMFEAAKLRKVVLGENFTKIGYASNSLINRMFYNCIINEVNFENATSIVGYSAGNNCPFYGANIKKLYFSKVTSFNPYQLFTYGNINLLIGQENCALSSTNNFGGNMASYIKKFVPHNSIDFYSQATNWASLFTNNGSLETQMFVWGKFTSGDTLPVQIGTTQVYNVTWYEDIDFTTLASGTATETKEYYGKITAVI